MSAQFSKHLRELTAYSAGTVVRTDTPSPWVALTLYSVGSIVYYGLNKYICSVAGTSSAVAPTHTTGLAIDGTVTWVFLTTLRDEQFDGNMYVFYGKHSTWNLTDTTPLPTLNDKQDVTTINDILTLRKVEEGDAAMAIKRTNWSSGSVYSQYDNVKNPEDYITPFFVIHNFKVFKCINNFNGAPSTVAPTGTGLFSTVDGYQWKYMYTIDAFNTKFITNDFIPAIRDAGVVSAATKGSISTFDIVGSVGSFSGVTADYILAGDNTTPATLSTNIVGANLEQVTVINPGAGYNGDVTYALIKNTVAPVPTTTAVITPTIASGIITSFTIDNAGAGYGTNAVIVVVDTATGSGFTGTVGLSGGVVTGITIVDGGTNYVAASTKVYIIPGVVGAVVYPIMAPYAGHGADVFTECNSNTMMVSVNISKVAGGETVLEGLTSDFRQIGIISDVKVGGKFANDIYMVGAAHPTPGALPKMDAGSGYVMYLNNLDKITRLVGQEEDVKIAITY